MPLIEPAIKVLQRRRKNQKVKSDYVFNSSSSEKGFIQEPKRQWYKELSLLS